MTNNVCFSVGSACSMLIDNDHMASTTTLQSHIPPILEIIGVDENEDEEVEAENTSLPR